ncbi:hypothetical protein DH2020_046831 [Rehmannia glutinosa]|uniref:Uncharacterized protein n=1 Tax=Rehmannia glutinosa TaxID=99300 RepID=A0ABR0UB88_REHGL
MMAITLSGADGRVVGGLIAGLTIAATPLKLQVFYWAVLRAQNRRSSFSQCFQSGENELQQHKGPSYSNSENQTNWAAMQNAERSRKSTADINISLHGSSGGDDRF